MKKLTIILSCLILLPLCSCQEKEELLYKADYVSNLTTVLGWYGLSGVGYTYENFISVAGSPISMGERTDELIHHCSFDKVTHTATEATGTGVDKVYYQKPGPVLQTHISESYKDLQFSWKYSNDVLTISYTTKDELIKDASYQVVWISKESISGPGTGSAASALFFSDKSKVEK